MRRALSNIPSHRYERNLNLLLHTEMITRDTIPSSMSATMMEIAAQTAHSLTITFTKKVITGVEKLPSGQEQILTTRGIKEQFNRQCP